MPLALEGPPLGSWSSHDKCGQCDGVELDCCYLRMLLTDIGPFLSRSTPLRMRQQAFDRRNRLDHHCMFLCPSLSLTVVRDENEGKGIEA